MSEKGNMEFSFIKKLSPQQKRLRNIAPFIVLPVVAIIYFIVESHKEPTLNTNTNAQSNINSYIDTELPASGTKELSNNKLEVFNEYETFDSNRKKQVSNDFDSHLGDPLGSDVVAEKAEKEVIIEKDTVENNRLKSEIARLEFEKNRRLAESYKSRPARTSSSSTTRMVSSSSSNTNYANNNSASNLDVSDWGDESDFFETTQVNNTSFNTNDSKIPEKKEGVTDKLIEAVIHNDQEVTNKGRATLRLKNQARIKGKLYPANTKFYASVQILENRVLLNITNIQSNSVALKAYDQQDGDEGIYVENQNFFAESTQEGTESIIDDQNFGGINVGNAVKRVFKRRAQIHKVTLLNNYELLLKL